MILALLPRRFQLSIPLGLNLLLMPGEHDVEGPVVSFKECEVMRK